MIEEAHENHKWLLQMVGDWEYESECPGPPGEPAQIMKGREHVRALGDLWVLFEGEGEMPGGGKMNSIITLGFDPARGRFAGTFIASMMTFLWVYDGELDEARRVLTLNVTGPDFSTPGKMAQYRDVLELVGPNERVLRSFAQGADGAWTQFMTMRSTRVG